MRVAWIRWMPAHRNKRGKAHARYFNELRTLCGRTTAGKDELEYVLDGANHCQACERNVERESH